MLGFLRKGFLKQPRLLREPDSSPVLLDRLLDWLLFLFLDNHPVLFPLLLDLMLVASSPKSSFALLFDLFQSAHADAPMKIVPNDKRIHDDTILIVSRTGLFIFATVLEVDLASKVSWPYGSGQLLG